MKKLVYILSLVIGFSACQSETTEVKIKKYYDLKGLIEKQIEALKSEKPKVQKNILVNESAENQTIDSLDWAKELDFFIQADLNKPAFVSSYQTDSSSMGVKYILKATEKLPVKFLEVNRMGEDGVEIKALVSNNNYLYDTERNLKLSLKNGQLIDYQIDGFQKVVFGDKKIFKVNGKILR
ncbi:MAG: hypothetical protein U5N85_00855 [Arcicella sp.]|nr:hypothetical protein [Arcicella sp.]